jgi:hypothetical protein
MSAAFAAKAAAGVAIVAATTFGATAGLNQITSSGHHPARARVAAPAYVKQSSHSRSVAPAAQSASGHTRSEARPAAARAGAPARGASEGRQAVVAKHRPLTSLGTTAASRAPVNQVTVKPAPDQPPADASAPNQTVAQVPAATGSTGTGETPASGQQQGGQQQSAPQHRASGAGSTATSAVPVISTPPAAAGVTIQLPMTSTPTVQIPAATSAPSVSIPGDGSGPTVSIPGAPPIQVPGVGSLVSLLGGGRHGH